MKEFLVVYRPIIYDWLFFFKVREKPKAEEDSKVISLKKSYSNNKKVGDFFLFCFRELGVSPLWGFCTEEDGSSPVGGDRRPL